MRCALIFVLSFVFNHTFLGGQDMHPIIESLESRRLLAANLLLNGSFETPAIGVGASGQGFTTFATGSTVGSGWKVDSGSVDIVSNATGTTYSTKAANGNQSIDLAGLAPGKLTQTVTTAASHRYLLTFAWTATPFLGGGSPDIRKMHVVFGGKTIATLSKTAVGLSGSSPGFATVTILVTATSASSALSFICDSAGTLGTMIDNVSLTAVPFGTAAITGQVFADGNGDGIKGTDAIGLSGWTVYIDLDKNGILDTGDIVTTTDHFGNFSIANLAAGTYTVKIATQVGWKTTTPASINVPVTTTTITDKLFGEQPI
jgi:hypothetical protein